MSSTTKVQMKAGQTDVTTAAGAMAVTMSMMPVPMTVTRRAAVRGRAPAIHRASMAVIPRHHSLTVDSVSAGATTGGMAMTMTVAMSVKIASLTGAG